MLKTLGTYLALGLVALAAIAFIVAVQQPPEYRVERSTVINATPEAVFLQIDDLKKCTNWSPWAARDPNMALDYSNPSSGVGAWAKWKSKTEGTGIQKIVESVAGQKLAFELEFIEPWTGTSSAAFVITPLDNGTSKLTWGMDGKNEGLSGKFFYKLMDVQTLVGKDFDRGLSAIKSLAEQN